MKYIRNARNQRGEVASLLTIVSMVVLSIGLLVGYQVNRNTATINPAPQAAEPAPSAPIPADGVDRHDEVCFPGGDKDQQVRDKYCRTRMYPAAISKNTIEKADARAKQVFSKIFQGTEQSKQNPFINFVTDKDQRTMHIYGGLCLNRSSLSGTKLSTEDVEVYVSLFGVRKYFDEKGAVGIVSNDKNAALRYKLAAAEDKIGSTNTDELFVATARDDVCTFTNTKIDPTDYTKTENPLLFDIQLAKASIDRAIANSDKDKSIQQKFDKEACEVYIHLRDNISAGNSLTPTPGTARANKPKDTYNIYKVDLRDILGDNAKDICLPTTTPTPPTSTPTGPQDGTPTPTTPDGGTPSPTPTRGPSATPSPTPVGSIAQCFESCVPSTVCGLDPVTKKRMQCYNSALLGNPPVLPTGTNESTDGAGNKLPFCENGDAECLCLPTRCQSDPSSCTTQPDACPNIGIPTPTGPTATPTTVTPTGVTPTGVTPTTTTPFPQACTFDALAYVQECTDFDTNGQCKRGANGKFVARAIDVSKLAPVWGASNNKQIAGGRYGAAPATLMKYESASFVGIFDALKERFPYYGALQFSDLSYLDYQASVPLPVGKSPLEKGSASDLAPEGRTKNPILIAPVHQYPNEQYFNFENAQVRLYADFANKGYRVVPDGNEIAFCKNNIVGNTIGACDMVAFQANRISEAAPAPDRDPRDSIHGLTVGCGQNIVYGWTLQKCNNEPSDYVFVIDTSSSMTTGKDISGDLKIDAAKKSIKSFLSSIKTYSKDSRAALVQFSSTANSGTVEELTGNIDQVSLAVDSKLKFESGTCIEDGLRQTISLLKRNLSNRKTYVVFLTDGMPNCPEGNPSPDSERIIGTLGAELKTFSNVKVFGIGVGDPTKTGVEADAEILRVIQKFTSTPELAFSTSSKVSIEDIYNNIQVDLNSCARTDALYANYVSSQDINGDGVINTIDLFLIYDNYFARGEDVPEDLNGDKIVNSLDVSIIVNNIGKTVEQENNTAQKSIGDVFN